MKKLALLVLAVVFAACSTDSGSSNTNSSIKEGVKPVADAEVAVIELENQDSYGSITIELYSNIAPKMVGRFKELSKKGFYNGVKFHRITPDVIQSGDPNSKDDDPTDDGRGGSDLPDLEAEFSDLEFAPGVVGAARGNDVNSANSQFFIMRTRQPNFDRRYTVFGKVIEGMTNVSTIGGAPATGERPNDDIVIKKIEIKPRS